ncbi:MAG: hypothetical protein C4547_08340 [Phycisphaerales bacterium]|nr:MAG: hypothetical protein C4547_08340 [Phycisphaerales bacterium]
MRFSLRGLPELDLFESDEQRTAAIAEIEREVGSPMTLGYWIAVAILFATVMVVRRYVKGWLQMLNVPPGVDTFLYWAAVLTTALIVLRWLHRWGAATELRQKLLEAGVPVCTKCGYCLRGLADSVGRCPECARPFDAQVVTLLEKAGRS